MASAPRSATAAGTSRTAMSPRRTSPRVSGATRGAPLAVCETPEKIEAVTRKAEPFGLLKGQPTSVTGAVIDLGLDHEMTARIGAKPNLAIEAGDVSGTLARWSLVKLAAGLHAGVKRSGPIVVE